MDLLASADAADGLTGWQLVTYARALQRGGRPAEAAALLPRLLQVTGGNSTWQKAVARLATVTRQWTTALDLWSAMVPELANDPEVHLQLARAFTGLGNPAACMEACERLLALVPEHEEGLRLRLRALGASERHAGAAGSPPARDPMRGLRGIASRGAAAPVVRAQAMDVREILAGDAALEQQIPRALRRGLAGTLQLEIDGQPLQALALALATRDLSPDHEDVRRAVERLRGQIVRLVARAKGPAGLDPSGFAGVLRQDPSLAAALLDLARNWLRGGEREAAIRLLASLSAAGVESCAGLAQLLAEARVVRPDAAGARDMSAREPPVLEPPVLGLIRPGGGPDAAGAGTASQLHASGPAPPG